MTNTLFIKDDILIKDVKKVDMKYTPHNDAVKQILELEKWINNEINNNLSDYLDINNVINIKYIISTFEKKFTKDMDYCWYTFDEIYNVYKNYGHFKVYKNEYGVPTIKNIVTNNSIDTLVVHTHANVSYQDVVIEDNNLIFEVYLSTIGNAECRDIFINDPVYSPFKKIKVDISKLLIIEKLIHGQHIPSLISYGVFV